MSLDCIICNSRERSTQHALLVRGAIFDDGYGRLGGDPVLDQLFRGFCY